MAGQALPWPFRRHSVTSGGGRWPPISFAGRRPAAEALPNRRAGAVGGSGVTEPPKVPCRTGGHNGQLESFRGVIAALRFFSAETRPIPTFRPALHEIRQAAANAYIEPPTPNERSERARISLTQLVKEILRADFVGALFSPRQ